MTTCMGKMRTTLLPLLLAAFSRSAVAADVASMAGGSSTTISHVFYINLESSKDRRAHMEEALSSFPGSIERVPAVTVDDLDRMPFSAHVQQQGLDGSLKPLSVLAGRKTAACWLSHVVLWERLEKQLGPQDNALIVEDDAQFPDGWMYQVGETLRSAPKGWDVLKVCGWGHQRAEDTVDEQWAVPRWPIWEDGNFLYTGSCGYIVSGSTVSNVLKRVLSQPIKDIDVAMMLPAKGDHGVSYGIYEQKPGRRLLSTGGFSSTIRAYGENYAHSNYAIPSFQRLFEPFNYLVASGQTMAGLIVLSFLVSASTCMVVGRCVYRKAAYNSHRASACSRRPEEDALVADLE